MMRYKAKTKQKIKNAAFQGRIHDDVGVGAA